MKFKEIVFLSILSILFLGCDSKSEITEDVLVKKEVEKSTKEAEKQTKIKEEDNNTPIFNLKTFDGKNIEIKTSKERWNFSGYDGKVILLDFFGTWCPPCKKEIPHLNSLREHYAGKFEILALDIGNRDGSINSNSDLEDFVMEFDIKYPVTKGKANNELFGGLLNIDKSGSIPFMILFDTNGQFVKPYIGMVSQEQLQSDIDQLLK